MAALSVASLVLLRTPISPVICSDDERGATTKTLAVELPTDWEETHKQPCQEEHGRHGERDDLNPSTSG
jgi:hypothetical protein